jgi:hypothetical protein
MKKCYLGALAALLLVSAPLFAQLPPSGATVGVYFDEEGTVSIIHHFPGLSTLDAYVVVYWEAMVGGASYSMNQPPPDVLVVAEEYPDGVNIGSPFDGCGTEVGLFLPGFGFYGTPVVISHIQLLNVTPVGTNVTLCIGPHCNYGEVVVSDNQANLFSGDGLCGVVGAESTTWGAVKNTYR